jgi:hypothetical protein
MPSLAPSSAELPFHGLLVIGLVRRDTTFFFCLNLPAGGDVQEEYGDKVSSEWVASLQ